MRNQLRMRPVFVGVLATGIAAIAVLAIGYVTRIDVYGRVFDHFQPAWIGLIAGGELVAYPAYILAYRVIARIPGGGSLSLPLVTRVVVAGFGPFSVGGGFGLDKRVLSSFHEDERSARVRVLALGTLEWAVLAPSASVTSIVLLATGANILPSLLWPWTVAVPLGFAAALWASSAKRADRLSRFRGRRLEPVSNLLAGVGVLHDLLRSPGAYAGAWVGTALYWAADIAAFYGGLRTFGLDPGAGKVIIAYATGYAATRRSLPLGGAGVTEVLMTYSLYWVREPLAPALAAVVAYRVFNFLLAATPALIAHRQLESMFTAGRISRRTQRDARPPPAESSDDSASPQERSRA
jgi:uncharacterized membrane protein YbhN (UPF0104 family)